jgi:hypothetical protein
MEALLKMGASFSRRALWGLVAPAILTLSLLGHGENASRGQLVARDNRNAGSCQPEIANLKPSDLGVTKSTLVLEEGAALKNGFGSEYSQLADKLAECARVLRLRGYADEANDIDARVKSMREHTDYSGDNSYVDWLLLFQAADLEEYLKLYPDQEALVTRTAPLRASELDRLAGLLRQVNRTTEAAKLEEAAKLIRSGGNAWREKYAVLVKRRRDEDAAIEKRYQDACFAEYVAALKESALPGMKLNLTLQERSDLQVGLRLGFGDQYDVLVDALEKYGSVLRLKGHVDEAKDIEARVQCMREHKDYPGANSFADWLLAYRANDLQYALAPLKNPSSEWVVRQWESTREWLPLELETLAAALRKLNRTTEAVKLEEQAAKIRSSVPARH